MDHVTGFFFLIFSLSCFVAQFFCGINVVTLATKEGDEASAKAFGRLIFSGFFGSLFMMIFVDNGSPAFILVPAIVPAVGALLQFIAENVGKQHAFALFGDTWFSEGIPWERYDIGPNGEGLIMTPPKSEVPLSASKATDLWSTINLLPAQTTGLEETAPISEDFWTEYEHLKKQAQQASHGYFKIMRQANKEYNMGELIFKGDDVSKAAYTRRLLHKQIKLFATTLPMLGLCIFVLLFSSDAYPLSYLGINVVFFLIGALMIWVRVASFQEYLQSKKFRDNQIECQPTKFIRSGEQLDIQTFSYKDISGIRESPTGLHIATFSKEIYIAASIQHYDYFKQIMKLYWRKNS